MTIFDLIFSHRFSRRVCRHLLFWIVFLVYFFYVNFLPTRPQDLWQGKTYLDAFELMIFFPISVLSVYIAIYLLLPRFILRQKYLRLLFLTVGLTFVYFSIAIGLTHLLAGLTRAIPFRQLPVSFRWFLPVRYGLGLPLTSAALTTIIKLLKSWRLKQRENELLRLQKINTELQLLKTQFQPHFIYDALQHIHILILRKSAQSPGALLRLSDLLSYILYDSERDYVPLKRELEMVRVYLGLKKTFHPEVLELYINQEIATDEMEIAPLLLVSLVEDIVAKLMSPPYKQLILTLNIKTEKNELYFHLECKSKFDEKFVPISVADDDWLQLLTRIKMQYPDRHSFDACSENDNTYILLIIDLAKIRPKTDRQIAFA